MTLRSLASSTGPKLALLATLFALAGPAIYPLQAKADSHEGSSPAARSSVRTVAPVVVKGKARHRTHKARKHSRTEKPRSASEFRKTAPSGALSDSLGRYAASHSDPNAATGQQREMMERAQGPAAGNDPDSGLGPR